MTPAAALLTRAPFTDRAHTTPFAPLSLTLGRAHGLTGAARRTLALVVAAARPGPVIWIAPAWDTDRLAGPGMARWIAPERVMFLRPKRGEDLLWCFEEALRSGAVPTVVCEVPGLPGLTPVRRLHLAAEQGMEMGEGPAPLGLLLTAQGHAPGVESAWSLAPVHPAPRHYAWRLARLKARSAPPADWALGRVKTAEGYWGLGKGSGTGTGG